MNFKISLPQCKVRYLIFILYNFFYILYMMGYTSQVLYFGTLLIFCCLNFFIRFINNTKNAKCIKELNLGIGFIATFLVISFIIQLIHRDFQIYLITGLIRIALPIINAFLFVNTVNENDQKYFFNVLLLRFIVHFIWQNYSFFNLQGLMSISWIQSSSEMETSMAHDFMIMEMYYLYRKENKKAFICMAFCMLSMKRLSFILAPLLIIFSKRVPVGVEVKRSYLTALKIITILSPFLILLLYTETSQNWLYQTFHIDLNQVMAGRVSIYETMKNAIPYYNGYGSINNFLAKYVMQTYGTIWNATLHNDFLRIYLETTIIGVIIMANNLIEMTRKEYWHFLMIAYLIFVAITSHIFNYFSVWVTFYLVIMCTHNNIKERDIKQNESWNRYSFLHRKLR